MSGSSRTVLAPGVGERPDDWQSHAVSTAIDIFISYTGKDRSIAKAIAAALSESGLEVWWDQLLQPGEVFDRQIQRVLEATTAIVAVLSPTALKSAWVRWEISQAHDNGLVVVPVLVKGASSEDLTEPLTAMHPVVLSPDALQSSLPTAICPPIHRRLELAKKDARSPRDRRSRSSSREARRRLASAAADTARSAESIKRAFARIDLPNPVSALSGARESAEQARESHALSTGLTDLLESLDVTIAFTSPQAGRLYMLGRRPQGGAVLNRQSFRKPTGLHQSGKTLVLGTLSHIYRLENILASGEWNDEVFSRCYIPRTRHYTGILDAHDVGLTQSGDIVFANTGFNCLASLSSTHSFKVLWKPEWVSEISPEDRCHLNGLAMRSGSPAFMTAVSQSDHIEGWRADLMDGGVVINIERNAILCDGLSIPHSPRFDGERLWVLNSGKGELGVVEESGGPPARFTPIAFCPGFVRGLAIHKGYAFVGVSRPRSGEFFELALEGRLAARGWEAWTGIVVIDTRTGELLEWLRLEGPIREIYDVAVLPGAFSAMSLGFMSHDAPGPITFEQ